MSEQEPIKVDPFEQRFTRSEIAESLDISTMKLQNWLQRKHISIEPKHKGGTGNRRLYSMFDIVQIAIFAELVDLNFSFEQANHIITHDDFREAVLKTIPCRHTNTFHELAAFREAQDVEFTIVECGIPAEIVEEIQRETQLKKSRSYIIIRLSDWVWDIEYDCWLYLASEADLEDLAPVDRAIVKNYADAGDEEAKSND